MILYINEGQNIHDESINIFISRLKIKERNDIFDFYLHKEEMTMKPSILRNGVVVLKEIHFLQDWKVKISQKGI